MEPCLVRQSGTGLDKWCRCPGRAGGTLIATFPGAAAFIPKQTPGTLGVNRVQLRLQRVGRRAGGRA